MTSSVSKTSILILLALKCPSTKYDRVNTLFQHDFGEFEKWNRALRSRALPLRCLRRGCSLVTVSPGGDVAGGVSPADLSNGQRERRGYLSVLRLSRIFRNSRMGDVEQQDEVFLLRQNDEVCSERGLRKS